jgi:hypothetical protein
MQSGEQILEMLLYILRFLQKVDAYLIFFEKHLSLYLQHLQIFPDQLLLQFLPVVKDGLGDSERGESGGDGIDEVALVLVGLADPVVCLLLPTALRNVEDEQGGRTVAEERVA